ncbi:MAG: hypothetical protein IJ723_03275, partial [Ruminococcus sp.]|nr:hypothetical protein [Ruminococcus sp.]
YPTDAELESRGIMISDNDEVFKSSECFYYDNGTPVTKIIEGSVTGANVANNLFIQSYQNQFVATVTFKKKNADVWLHGAVATDTGEALVDADYYTYHEADIAEGGTKKIYIYDNHVYDSEEEVKAQMPGRLDKDILVHFLYDSDNPDQNYAGLTFIDGETLPRSSTTNMHKIPDNETTGDSICRIAQTSNFDITVTLIKAGASVKMYNTSQYGGYGAAVDGYPVLDENSPEEIWVFRGVAYSSTEDMPGYKVIDKHVTVHYLGGGNSTTDGVVLQDLDAYSESSQANGDWIADDGFASFGNSTENPDVEVDVLVRREGTVVGVGGKQVGGSDMEGDVVVELNANSPSDVWIYAGKSYGDDGTSAKNQRDADVKEKMEGELTATASAAYDENDLANGKYKTIIYTLRLENKSEYKVSSFNYDVLYDSGISPEALTTNIWGGDLSTNVNNLNGNTAEVSLDSSSHKINFKNKGDIRIEPNQSVEILLKLTWWTGMPDGLNLDCSVNKN